MKRVLFTQLKCFNSMNVCQKNLQFIPSKIKRFFFSNNYDNKAVVKHLWGKRIGLKDVFLLLLFFFFQTILVKTKPIPIPITIIIDPKNLISKPESTSVGAVKTTTFHVTSASVQA